ncbi:MAG: DUF3859 domain-containing protein [Pseudomonadales bacterium]
MFRISILTLCMSLASTSSAALTAAVLESGIFEKSERSSEDVLIQGKETVKSEKIVPGLIGQKFGVRFTLSDPVKTDHEVTFLYLTPGIVHPDGSRHDKYEVSKILSSSTPSHAIAFEFTDRWEIRFGTWEMFVFEGDRLLLRERFEVVVPEDVLR